MGHLVKDCACCAESGDPDCSTCLSNCSGAPILTMTISGFIGDCAGLNGVVVLDFVPPFVEPCFWSSLSGWRIACVGNQWEVLAETLSGPFGRAGNPAAALSCNGGSVNGFPTGSAPIVGLASDLCDGQTGTVTFSQEE